MELDNSIQQMITKDLVQKMITSMGGQSKSSISNIDSKTLTVLE